MKPRIRILFLIIAINIAAVATVFLLNAFREKVNDQAQLRQQREAFQKWNELLQIQHRSLEPLARTLPADGAFFWVPSEARLQPAPDRPAPEATPPGRWYFSFNPDGFTIWHRFRGSDDPPSRHIGIPLQASGLLEAETFLNATPHLIAPDSASGEEPDLMTFQLTDASRNPVGHIQFSPHSGLLSQSIPDVFPLLALLLLCVLITISALAYWWLIRPVHALGRAVHERDRSPLKRLRRVSGEISPLVRAIDDLFGYQDSLQSEIALRQVAEEQLLQREDQISHLYREREQLNRDLHDDTIQNLFALGLTVENSNHPQSEHIRKTLNETIARLRTVLEEGKSATAGESLSSAVQSLVDDFNQIGITRIQHRLASEAAAAFSNHVLETKLILTEAISNGIRHGRAETITIELSQEASTAILTISDDGRGCDLDQTPVERGLRNIRKRAAQFGATTHYASTPGHGFTVQIEKPHEIVT